MSPSPLSASAFRLLSSSPSLRSLLTVDGSATGEDPSKFPHPAVFLSIAPGGPTRLRLRWPQAVERLANEVEGGEGRREAGVGEEELRYLRYCVEWMRRWSRLPRLTPALTPHSRLHRWGLPWDPTRAIGLTLATLAAAACAAAWQQWRVQEGGAVGSAG